MLRSMTQVLPKLGVTGSVILFDEGDRVMSLSANRSQRLMDNLRQLVDLCGQARFPSVMVLMPVPPEFLRNVVPDYPALHQRLSSVSPLSERSPQAPVIDLEHLDLPPAQLLEEIGVKVMHVFEIARRVELDEEKQRENAKRLAHVITRHHFEVSHRRVFVKAWVDLLYGQVAEGEMLLPEASLEGVAGSTARQLSAPERRCSTISAEPRTTTSGATSSVTATGEKGEGGVGRRVRHPSYGLGTVQRVERGGLSLRVLFDQYPGLAISMPARLLRLAETDGAIAAPKPRKSKRRKAASRSA
jgi:hypothetical protein